MKNKMNIFLFVTFLCIVLFPRIVNAECSESEKQNLIKLAENIQVKYEHVKENKYKISFLNLPSQITITSTIGDFYNVEGISTSNIVEGYEGGVTYKFFYMANTRSNCEIQTLITKDIKIPAINKYSEKEICKDPKYYDFELCKSDYNKEITDEIFEKKLKEYEKKINNDSEAKKEKDNGIFEFLKDNVYLMSGIFGIVILSIIVIIFSKKRKIKF